MSSKRNCNIRVTSVNNTEKGQIIYTLEDIKNIIEDWHKSQEMEYFYIQHEADEEDENIHFHIIFRFYKNPVPFENIKAKFPYGYIENTRNIKRSIQYLIHKNDKSKKQYEWSDIITNCEDMTKYQTNTLEQDKIAVEYYINQIEIGAIREYEQTTKIPIGIWSRNKTVITNSLTYYRERIMMDNNREIRVVIMTGDTGTGKTTFAKKYCEANNKSYCVSSSSNDFMQDYKGQDVMIFDDIRDTDIKFTDILKMLDNHTRSTVVSRYFNKGFIGDTLILTSYKPLSEWYMNITRESKEQLYRRITEQYQFKKDGIIDIFLYDEKKHRYEYYKSIKNIFKFEEVNRKKFIDELIMNMGNEIEIIETNDTNISIEEFVQIDEQQELPFKI